MYQRHAPLFTPSHRSPPVPFAAGLGTEPTSAMTACAPKENGSLLNSTGDVQVHSWPRLPPQGPLLAGSQALQVCLRRVVVTEEVPCVVCIEAARAAKQLHCMQKP